MGMFSKFIAILTVIIFVMAGIFHSFEEEKDVSVNVLLDEDRITHITNCTYNNY